MSNIFIKKATLNDVEKLQAISKQTFYEAFAAVNTEENMLKYLEESFSVEKLTTELSDTNSEFYFASLSHTIIGYLKLNTGSSQTDIKDENALEIERIYVLQEFLGKKVGQLLYQKATEVAKEKKAHYVWLGVWEENARAINFYRKNGFAKFDNHIFMLGDDKQRDILMRLKLKD